MRTADFDFALPQELIAQHPAPKRDESRLLVLYRNSGNIEHGGFRDVLNFFRGGDLLVLNDSRVIPARVYGANAKSGGQFELLLLEENSTNDWWTMIRPGKRARIGTQILLRNTRGEFGEAQATVVEKSDEGHYRLKFSGLPDLRKALGEFGRVPLPPYINRDDTNGSEEDRERYQTVFAHNAGSVAAPTAGLHFTPELLEQIRARGVEIHFVTLHVGPGTFLPVKTESLSAHTMHEEPYELSVESARAVNDAKTAGRRVFAVGTTTVRVLESVAQRNGGKLVPESGRTRIFIYPPFEFKIVDALLTNFHLPRSTLLMLVSAFAAPGKTSGREIALAAYAEAVRQRYRFFSYGDAMLLL